MAISNGYIKRNCKCVKFCLCGTILDRANHTYLTLSRTDFSEFTEALDKSPRPASDKIRQAARELDEEGF